MTPHDAYTKRLESLFAAAMDMYTNTITVIIVITVTTNIICQVNTALTTIVIIMIEENSTGTD